MSSLLPFLRIGTTLAIFHSFGKLPVLYEILKRSEKGYARVLASFSKFYHEYRLGRILLYDSENNW